MLLLHTVPLPLLQLIAQHAGVSTLTHPCLFRPDPQAKSIGQAIITCAPKEHAEHYAQQLWQRGCHVNLEPDTTTI